MTDDGYLV